MYIIIINITVIFFLAAVFLYPFAFWETGLMTEFWRNIWPAGLVMFLALCGMNVFFLLNRRLLSLLKREDWPALAAYLEQKIYREGKYSSRNIRLLAHACLVMGDFDGVLRLETGAAAVKPALVEDNALVFGVARILGGTASSAADFFMLRLQQEKAGDREWLNWYYGFSLTAAKSFDRAEAVFGESCSAKDPLAAGLSAFFLSEILGKHSLNGAECRVRAAEGVRRVQKALKNAGRWKKEAEKLAGEIHGAVIKQYLDEAGVWLFKERNE